MTTQRKRIRGGSSNVVRMDDFANLMADVAASRQFGTTRLDLGGAFMGARAAYAGGGLVARVVDMPADAATARGVTVVGAADDLYSELDRLSVLDALSDGLRWALLDGGGAILVLTKDGGSLADPINVDSLQEIEELRVLALPDLKADMDRTYENPAMPNYGQPQFYKMTAGGRNDVEVHETRLIPIPGAPTVSEGTHHVNNVPWAGRGLGSKALRAIERYRCGVDWAEALLQRKQQAVHRMKGLAEMLMADQESVVRKRIDLVDANRSSLNGVAVDIDDDYNVLNADLGGVQQTIAEMQSAVSAETGFPITLLFGRSPGGLNATGESDWAVFYEMVGQLQRKRLTKALERLVSLIYAQTGGMIDAATIPDDWKIEWNPLPVLNEQQTAEVGNKKAATLKAIADAVSAIMATGAVSTDEAHAYLEEERLFGLVPEETDGASGAAGYAGET